MHTHNDTNVEADTRLIIPAPSGDMLKCLKRVKEVSDNYELKIAERKNAARIIARDLISPLLGEEWEAMLPPKTTAPSENWVAESRIEIVDRGACDHPIWFKRVGGRKAEDYLLATMPYLPAVEECADAVLCVPNKADIHSIPDRVPAAPIGVEWGLIRADAWDFYNPGHCAFILFGAALAPVARRADPEIEIV